MRNLIEEARRAGVYNASAAVVLPTNAFYDEFLVVRGKKEDPCGIPGESFLPEPEKSYKNVGGGWDAQNILRYLEDNDIELESLSERLEQLGARNSETLLKFGAVTEVWEEVRFFIPPDELPLLFKVFEEHVTDRDGEEFPHIKVIFATPRIFTDEPILHKEIFDSRRVHVKDLERGEAPVAFIHREAIIRAYKILRKPDDPEAKQFFNCNVKRCPICRSR